MTTTVLLVFIGGLVFTAILGGVCGYYALKLLLLIEKDQVKAERARQAGGTKAPQPTDEKQQA